MFTGFYTTNKGRQYIARAVAGKNLVITKALYGDGEMPDGAEIPSMTALVSPLADLPISKKSITEDSVTIKTQFSNKVNGQILMPFYLMEAGIFGKVKNADGTDDEDCPETLLYYANALTKEKADYIPGTLTEFIMNWPLTISSAESVTVEINESLIYPTMHEFNERTAIATEEEAKAGTDNAKMMTPLRVSNYVNKVLGDVNTILDEINGKVV